MFDVKNFALPRKMTLAEALNGTLCDLMSHRRPQLKGFRFVSRGPDTAYLKVPGDQKGAICVHLEEGEIQATVYLHPSRTGKEAWEMSATKEGCDELCSDPDMEEDRAWVYPTHESYTPPMVGGPVPPGLYDVVLSALGRFVSCSERHETLPNECYF